MNDIGKNSRSNKRVKENNSANFSTNAKHENDEYSFEMSTKNFLYIH